MTKRAPRPPRKPPLTAWGRFLVAQRLDRKWTQREAFDHFRPKFGWRKDSLASYGNLERGPIDPDRDKQRVFLSNAIRSSADSGIREVTGRTSFSLLHAQRVA